MWSSSPDAIALEVALSGGRVGLETVVNDHLIPGSELKSKPDVSGRAAGVVRVKAARPHGTLGFRYDLSVVPLEAGRLNVSSLLVRVDEASTDPIPALWLEVAAKLPPGPPKTLPPATEFWPSVGGYRQLLKVGAVLWFAGLALILWLTRKAESQSHQVSPEAAVTVADQLRPLLSQAATGRLDGEGKALLDRLVLGFWRDRRSLTHLPMAEALRQLRQDDEAGSLLRQVESWLHQRPSDETTVSDAEIARHLRPYLEAPAPSGHQLSVTAPNPTSSHS